MDNQNIMQQAFEKSATELLKQKKKSMVLIITSKGEKIESCMYRSPDGLKCAIGHLIDDKDYKTEMESKGGEYLLNNYKFDSSPLLDKSVDYSFYSKLQRIHDFRQVEDWKNDLIQFGKHFQLDTKFLEN